MMINNIPERVGEHVVRGIASLVSLTVVIVVTTAVLTDLPWIAAAVSVFLFVDFLLRAAGLSVFSPYAQLSRALQGNLFRFKPRMITAQPKRFAAGIGAFITAGAAVSWYYGAMNLEYGLLAVLLLFSFLEAAFRFCAGCRVFALLVSLRILREDVCTDCVVPGGDGI